MLAVLFVVAWAGWGGGEWLYHGRLLDARMAGVLLLAVRVVPGEEPARVGDVMRDGAAGSSVAWAGVSCARGRSGG